MSWLSLTLYIWLGHAFTTSISLLTVAIFDTPGSVAVWHCVTMQLKSGILWGWIGLSRDGGALTTMQPVKSSTRGLRTESLEGSSGRCNPPPTIPAFCQTEGARQPTVALFSSTFFGHRLLRTSLLATATAWTEYNHFSRVAWNGLLAGQLSSNARVGFCGNFPGGLLSFFKVTDWTQS